MHMRTGSTLLAVLLVTALPAGGQQVSPGLVSRIIRVEVDPGSILAFEAALREHMGLHAQNNDPWAWYTWQVVNGDRIGDFLIRSHGHHWQDFDRRSQVEELDLADLLANVAPHIRSMSSTLEVFEPSISNWPDDVGRPAMVELSRFWLTYEGVSEFVHVLQRVHRAVEEKDPSIQFAWSTTANGSEGPAMTLAVPRGSWEEFASDRSQIWKMVEEVHGETEARLLRATIGRAIRAASSSIIRYRADLSYEPAE